VQELLALRANYSSCRTDAAASEGRLSTCNDRLATCDDRLLATISLEFGWRVAAIVIFGYLFVEHVVRPIWVRLLPNRPFPLDRYLIAYLIISRYQLGVNGTYTHLVSCLFLLPY